MADQLTPAVPGPFDFGRLDLSSALAPGWLCRWCKHPLRFVLNHQTREAAGPLGCCACDNAAPTERTTL